MFYFGSVSDTTFIYSDYSDINERFHDPFVVSKDKSVRVT